MGFISASTLQKLANTAAKALPDDCTIKRKSLQNSQITSTAIEQVKCLATPLKLQTALGVIEGFQGNMMMWHVQFPLGTNPLEDDELTINDQVMTVQKVYKPKSYAVFDEVEASGVKG